MDIIGYVLTYPIVSELPDASSYPDAIVIYSKKLWYSNGNQWILCFGGDTIKVFNYLSSYFNFQGG